MCLSEYPIAQNGSRMADHHSSVKDGRGGGGTGMNGPAVIGVTAQGSLRIIHSSY